MSKSYFAVVGSRTYPLPKDIHMALSPAEKAKSELYGRAVIKNFIQMLDPDEHVLVSGGAKGVDTWAAEYAVERGIEVFVIPALWDEHGRGAGMKRNTDIVRRADNIAIFWDGDSRGTMDTMTKAQKFKKPYVMFGGDGQVKLAVTAETLAAEKA